MFRFVICTLIIVVMPAFAESPSILKEIANTTSDEELARIAKRLEAREPFLLDLERQEHGDALYALGQAWFESKENDRARVAFERLLDGWEETHGGVAALGLGNISWRLEETDEAIAFFERSLVAQDVRTSRGVRRASATRWPTTRIS